LFIIHYKKSFSCRSFFCSTKNNFILLFLLFSSVILSQKKVVEKFESQSKEIEISTIGLDNFVLENSTSGFIEITLFAENINDQHIFLENKNDVLKVEFKIAEIQTEETVFRKYITKRLHRAFVIIKIPKGKKVTIFGDEINIESKNYQEDVTIFIEKGIVKLNQVKANVSIKLYEGSVYGTLKNSNINVTSKTGKIKVDTLFYKKNYIKKIQKNKNNFSVVTIKANIFLTTK
tara:strand:+ start:2075 stop:2773 length:699 start_codon:yes stop_codon:yes gene_type:complete